MSASLYFACNVEFFIAAADFPAAVAALRGAGPRVREAWGIDNWGKKVLKASEGLEPREAIAAIFDNFGWELFFDRNGDITDVYLSRDGAPDYIVGIDYDPLFDILAPYVRDGSHIQMISSDGSDVVYHFRNGKCQSEAMVDPLDPRRAVVRRDVLERIHAYLIASDVSGGGTGAALAAELKREISQE